MYLAFYVEIYDLYVFYFIGKMWVYIDLVALGTPVLTLLFVLGVCELAFSSLNAENRQCTSL